MALEYEIQNLKHGNNPYDFRFVSKTGTSYMIRVGDSSSETLSVGVMEVPWNCSLILVYGFSSFSNKNPATVFRNFLRFVINSAEEDGYTKIMYTTSKNQNFIISALKSEGFVSIDTYESRRTRAEINIWVYEITSEYEDYDEDDDEDYDEDDIEEC